MTGGVSAEAVVGDSAVGVAVEIGLTQGPKPGTLLSFDVTSQDALGAFEVIVAFFAGCHDVVDVRSDFM